MILLATEAEGAKAVSAFSRSHVRGWLAFALALELPLARACCTRAPLTPPAASPRHAAALFRPCRMHAQGGQSLLKGLDICVHRNYFGSQVHSFEAAVKVRPEFQERLGGAAELPGVFIRAPALLSVGDGVDVVATVVAERRDVHGAAAEGAEGSVATSEVIVAAARGATRLVTAFHPELAASKVWHELFVTMVEASMAGAAAPGAVTTA